MPGKIATPGYMHRFKCLGKDCSDTCCQHWDINLDRKHYAMLETAVADIPELDKIFKSHVQVHKEGGNHTSAYGFITLGDDGYCPFLDDSGLCEIHASLGVEPLSDICAFFPRVLAENDGRLELTGALSCPEVVARCFTATQGEQWFEEFEDIELPRSVDLPLVRKIDKVSASFYERNFELIRKLLLEILNLEQYALETRLYFLANFSYRISGCYHQLAETNEEALQEEIARIRSQSTLQQLEDYSNRFESSEPIAIIVIQAILQLRMTHARDDKLSQSISKIFDYYNSQSVFQSGSSEQGNNPDPRLMWRIYQEHWDGLNAVLGVEFEGYIIRYLINCIQREWYISMPDPFVYVQMLLIRVAVLRFLIVSDPKVMDLIKDAEGNDRHKDKFQEEVIRVVYLFARSIDHNHAFLSVIFQAILEQQMMSFDYSLPFIKF